VDDEIERLYLELDERLPDHTSIITADHGEAFWEHAEFDRQHFYDSRPAYCVGHGGTPYDSIARVPYVSHKLDRGDHLNSLVDILPQLLGRAGMKTSEAVDGIGSSEVIEKRTPLIEATRYGHEKKAVYSEEWKLLVSKGDDQHVGFKLPDETRKSISDPQKDTLETVLPEWPRDGKENSVSTDTQQQLENLGYI
jgi:arylsulfatase A-like enzyme